MNKRDESKNAGFSDVSLQEIIQYEYYKTENDLLALLSKTPILDSFSGIANSKNNIEIDLFKKYVNEHTSEKGIELKRVLYGIIAKK